MKSHIPSTTLLLLALLAPLCAQNLPPIGDDWEAQYTNGIAAVVEDRVITVDQLRKEMAPIVPQIRDKVQTREEFDRQLEQLSFDILNSLIDQVLILKDFEKLGAQIPELYIQNQFDDYVAEHFKGDRANFLKWLRSEGKTPRDFRKELRERMIIDYMRGRMRRSQSYVSPERIKEYYDRNQEQFSVDEAVKLHQIMLAPSKGETPELLLQQARKLLDRIQAGESFEAVAEEVRNEASSGQLGWVGRKDFNPKLGDPFAAATGDILGPVSLENYVFLIKIEDRREAGVLPLDDVREQIEVILSTQVAREAQQRWIERLRKDAFIKFYL